MVRARYPGWRAWNDDDDDDDRLRPVPIHPEEFDCPDPLAVLGLALQKNDISLYNSASNDDGPFTCGYSGRLGRARVSSNGVVTFVSRRDINLEALAEMVAATEAGLAAGVLTVS